MVVVRRCFAGDRIARIGMGKGREFSRSFVKHAFGLFSSDHVHQAGLYLGVSDVAMSRGVSCVQVVLLTCGFAM
jgi:hypothetical protein